MTEIVWVLSVVCLMLAVIVAGMGLLLYRFLRAFL